MVQSPLPHSPPPDPTSTFWEEEEFQEMPVPGLESLIAFPASSGPGDWGWEFVISLFFDFLKLARGSVPDVWWVGPLGVSRCNPVMWVSPVPG